MVLDDTWQYKPTTYPRFPRPQLLSSPSPGFHRCRGFFLCRLDRVGGKPTEEQLTPRKRRGSKPIANNPTEHSYD